MKNLMTALKAVQSELKPIFKNAENPHFRSSYVDLAGASEVILPLLAKNGLCVSQVGELLDTRFVIVTKLMHESGEMIESRWPVVTDKQTAQAIGSATTYARRYSLMAIVGASSSDDDDGNASSISQQVAPKQPDKPRLAPPTTQDPDIIEKPIIEQIGDLARVKGVTNAQLKEFISKMGKKKSAECTEEELMTILNWLRMK